MGILAKLAFRGIKSKKANAAVTITAIFLTIILFMTVVSVAANLYTGYRKMALFASGTDFHGFLISNAFSCGAEELLDAVRDSEGVSESTLLFTSLASPVSSDGAAGPEEHIRAVLCEEDLRHFYVELKEGRFPESDDELLVDPRYFPDAELNGEFRLSKPGIPDESVTFRVSGFIDSRVGTGTRIFVRYSEGLQKLSIFDSSPSYLNVYVSFSDDREIEKKFEKLVNQTLGDYCTEGSERFYKLNASYLDEGKSLNSADIFLVVFLAAVVFFCSFLLIYNIYSIALTRDMRLFGLFNVIGMTHAQIRSMTIIKTLILFAATLPFGLFAGYFVGWRLLSPMLVSSLMSGEMKFEFSPLIPVLTAVLTLFTLIFSAARPLRKLKKLTPIAAVDYSPAAEIPEIFIKMKKRSKKTAPDALRMAKYSVFRNSGKTVITSLGMSVSVILFVLVSAICECVAASAESGLQLTDYIIKPNYSYSYGGTVGTLTCDADSGIGIGAEYAESVGNLASVERVMKARTAMTAVKTPDGAVKSLAELKKAYGLFGSFPELEAALSGELDILVVGIPDELFGELKISDDSVLGAGYENGYAVLDGGRTGGIILPDGTRYALSYFEDGETIGIGSGYRIVKSGVLNPSERITGWIGAGVYRAVLYIPESGFLRDFGEGEIYALLIDSREGMYDSARSGILSLADSFGVTFYEAARGRYLSEAEKSGTAAITTLSYMAGIDGRMDGLEEIHKTVRAIRTVGYSLSVLIFLIGALNVINTSLSSAVTRRREFAMLEAVGMTGRQLSEMILTESLYGCAFAAAIAVFIGFPLILLVVRGVIGAAVPIGFSGALLMIAVSAAVSVISGVAAVMAVKASPVVERIRSA